MDTCGHIQKQHEPIAIIGIGCRLPGNSSSASELWDALAAGRSGHCGVPQSRYNAPAFYHPDPARPGSINFTTGYFIQEEIRDFENTFFGINNLETLFMDAQQRKLLEVTYESLESAGLSLNAVAGRNIGCYVGNFALDHLVMQLHDPEYVSRYTAIGGTPNILANRISHTFNLTGPSLVLDTACSSSLYALHYACCALDIGECEAAIVASANLVQSPQHQMIATKAGIVSNTGLCRTFDEDADGYGRAEGVGALVLKKLSHAVRDGDPIRALIRGTAVNRTNGIMLPDTTGQEKVINMAYLRAGLPTDRTDYVEAHGTGTAIGDPIEVQAISKALSHKTGRPTLIGSVKTNLGHSEAASGISSVIKVILSLERQMIPPTIGIKKINPKVSCRGNVAVVRTLTPWPKSDCPRASINSFGFGGANSHAIVESAGSAAWSLKVTSVVRQRKRLLLLPISAASTASLARRFQDLKDFLQQPFPDIPLGCTAYTLAERLTQFSKRGYMLVDEGAQEGANRIRREKVPQNAPVQEHRPVALLFTGQGAQWQGMGAELYHHFETFRNSINDLDVCLSSDFSCPYDLASLFSVEGGAKLVNIDDPWMAQLSTTAIQIAIVDLLRHFGITPSAVIGHSSGEIAASYTAGLLSRKEAILCSNARGRAVVDNMARLPSGAMLAVGLGEQDTLELLNSLNIAEQVNIACVNSPVNVTISGDSAAIGVLEQALNSKSIFNRRLRTGGVAYHSHHMRAFVGPTYRQLITRTLRGKQLTLCEDSQTCMISTVKNAILDAKVARSPQYWQNNLEDPVHFDAALRALLERGPHHMIEVGPHCALKAAFHDICQSRAHEAAVDSSLYGSVLIRNNDAQQTLLELLGHLYAFGLKFCFEHVNRIETLERHVETRLPRYPWDYSKGLLWREPRAITELRNRRYQRHELLGSMVTGGNKSTWLWRNLFSVEDVKWVHEHRFGPTVLFPAAGFLAMAIEAICQAHAMTPSTCSSLTLRDIRFFKALPLDSAPVELLTELRRLQISAVESSSRWWCFSIGSLHQQNFTAHVSGLLKVDEELVGTSLAPLSLNKQAFEERDPRVWVRKMKSMGLNLGPNFTTLNRIWVDRCRKLQEAMTEIRFSRGREDEITGNHDYIVHPTTLDGLLQSTFIASTAGDLWRSNPWIPVAIEELRVAAPSSIDMSTIRPWYALSTCKNTGMGTIAGNSDLINAFDEALIRIRGTKAITYQGIQKADDPFDQARFPMLRVCWKPEVTNADEITGQAIETHANFFRTCGDGAISAIDAMENAEIASFLDLVCHKQPNSRILSIGPNVALKALYTSVLSGKSEYRRFREWDHLSIDCEGGVMSIQSVLDNSETTELSMLSIWPARYQHYDIVISNSLLHDACMENIILHTKPCAKIFVRADGPWEAANRTGNRSVVALQARPCGPNFLFVSGKHITEGGSRQVYLVTGASPSRPGTLEKAIADQLMANNFKVDVVQFQRIQADTLSRDALVLSTIELEQAVLSNLHSEQISRLKTITNTARRILWLTKGRIMQGKSPDSVLMIGAARAIMLEQPSLKIATFDIDESCDISITAAQAVDRLDLIASRENVDLEYAQHARTVYISRWIPDHKLNHRFKMKQAALPETLTMQQVCNFQIGIEQPGQLATVRFVESVRRPTLADDHIEVEARCYGMNAKDVYLLNAKFDTPEVTVSTEMSGIVVRVGANVKQITAGDRIATMAPGNYEKFQVVPEWSCQKLQPGESFEDACTLPVVFSTALYALKHKARLAVGETVLIHSATGGLGLATIQVAKHMGAEIYATVGSEHKRRYLVETCGIPERRIFNSRSATFLSDALEATSGRGVDVVVNSLTGELLHAGIAVLAPFGRFIELGKKDILESGKLDMKMFSRHLSFHALDLMDLYVSRLRRHHLLFQELISETFSLLREGRIQPVQPSQKFDVSQISQAFRRFVQPSRLGKVIVSFHDPKSSVTIVRKRYYSTFDPDKTYLMVGCLGGVGRSIARWMVTQGARSFVFMSRSGLTRSSARELVSDLEMQGVESRVLTSDVTKMTDVQKAITLAPTPIGGVVQASMAVKATNWESLSSEQWHQGLEAKVHGTWNLHSCLLTDLGSSLNFFLLLSSLSGTIGSPTEPSYCAANAFMDNFARFRRRTGLPGISLGLGIINDVGYLHEHPEMEAILTRRGFQGISEDEMLQMVDIAIHGDLNPDFEPEAPDPLMHSHILTGLELLQAKTQARKNGSAPIEMLFQDQRSSILAASYARDIGQDSNSLGQAESASFLTLPTELHRAVKEGTVPSEAVCIALSNKFSDIIMLSKGQLEIDTPIVNFGLDSMLAAEFRNFIFQVFKVDLPFMTLLAQTTTIRSLSESVTAKLFPSETAERRQPKQTM